MTIRIYTKDHDIYTRNQRERKIQNLLDNKELLDFTNGRGYTRNAIAKVLYDWYTIKGTTFGNIITIEHYLNDADWYISGKVKTEIMDRM